MALHRERAWLVRIPRGAPSRASLAHEDPPWCSIASELGSRGSPMVLHRERAWLVRIPHGVPSRASLAREDPHRAPSRTSLAREDPPWCSIANELGSRGSPMVLHCERASFARDPRGVPCLDEPRSRGARAWGPRDPSPPREVRARRSPGDELPSLPGYAHPARARLVPRPATHAHRRGRRAYLFFE
jgi:hypothetical protein